MREFRLIFITAVIAAVVALLIIGGCATKQPVKAESQQLPAQQPSSPPQQTPTTEANAQQQAQQPATEQDDLYKDNLDEAIDDLSQLE